MFDVDAHDISVGGGGAAMDGDVYSVYFKDGKPQPVPEAELSSEEVLTPENVSDHYLMRVSVADAIYTESFNHQLRLAMQQEREEEDTKNLVMASEILGKMIKCEKNHSNE